MNLRIPYLQSPNNEGNTPNRTLRPQTKRVSVEGVKSDKDKRVVLAQLTDKGREAGDNSPELLQAGFMRSFRTLQPWEQNMLIASLQRIAELMDAEDLDASPFLDTGEIGR